MTNDESKNIKIEIIRVKIFHIFSNIPLSNDCGICKISSKMDIKGYR